MEPELPISNRKEFLKKFANKSLVLIMGVPITAHLLDCSGRFDAVQDIKLTNSKAVLTELTKILTTSSISQNGNWSVAKTFLHCAQSIEYSMTGYPEMKSAIFRSTVGRLALYKFTSDGAMSHNLNDPIDGAPVIKDSIHYKDAIEVLMKKIKEFDAFTGKPKPHFAYGEVTKKQYEILHSIHVANHLTIMRYKF